MRISENWLREFVDPEGGTEALVRQLTGQGIEVDGTEPAGAVPDGVVAGQVLEVARHPDADRLQVCQVQAGAGVVQVVCGAANVRAGGVYPLALVGTVMGGGREIRKASLRGVPSEGMLCSAAELGLGEGGEGLLELDPALAPGTPVGRVLGLPDQVLDLNITPNRADCFSLAGIARDVAAATGAPFRGPDGKPVAPAIADTFPAVVAAPEACPVFALRVIRGLAPGARSPSWLRERLRRSGIRSISPVVDVTNYVMLELGQPLHAYDLARLKGPMEVRLARAGETLRLLTGAEVRLDPDVLVIADQAGALGLAGIMGGEGSGVSASTTDILLESAFFHPAAIAGRARRYGLQTDASMRFERGVDPALQARAIERAAELILQIAGGQAGAVSTRSSAANLPSAPTIPLRSARLAQVLGLAVDPAEVEGILGRLGMKVTAMPAGWAVVPPTCRFDISLEVDLIEEVARIHGYDRIPPTPGTGQIRLPGSPEVVHPADRVRDILVGRGFQEAVTYSFTDPVLDRLLAAGGAEVGLRNPLASDQAVLRRSVWPGLLQALRHNQARQQRRVRLFECGRRFALEGAEVREESVVAALVCGSVVPEQWGVAVAGADFFDIKADLEALVSPAGERQQLEFRPEAHPALHPGQSARVYLRGVPLGWVGALHPGVVAALDLAEVPLVFEVSLAPLAAAGTKAYRAVSRFPAVRRDLSLRVDASLPASRLLAAVREAAGSVFQDAVLFDIYQGEGVESGQKSVALGLILQETSRTLTDAEVDQVTQSVVGRLAREFGATIRS